MQGEDRISDANHLTAALTGRQLDPETGEVKIAASVGQLFRFQAPEVTLPGEPAIGDAAEIADVGWWAGMRSWKEDWRPMPL